MFSYHFDPRGGGGGYFPMWGDGDVPKFGVYFCHPISRIFGPLIEHHGYVPDFWVGFRNL